MGDAQDVSPENGFEITELLEPQVPEGATTTYDWAPYDWARRWPVEEIWNVRKGRLTMRRGRAGTPDDDIGPFGLASRGSARTPWHRHPPPARRGGSEV